MNNLRKLFQRGFQARPFHCISPRLCVPFISEPPYLDANKSEIPMYDTLNIQLRGYDFAIVESYQKFVHRLMKKIEVDVEDAWAVPHQELQVTNLKPKSDVVSGQFTLKVYERTVQITDVFSTKLPTIIRALEASTPAGVTVDIVEHQEWHEQVRYVPDTELKQLKEELDELGGPIKKK